MESDSQRSNHFVLSALIGGWEGSFLLASSRSSARRIQTEPGVLRRGPLLGCDGFSSSVSTLRGIMPLSTVHAAIVAGGSGAAAL